MTRRARTGGAFAAGRTAEAATAAIRSAARGQARPAARLALRLAALAGAGVALAATALVAVPAADARRGARADSVRAARMLADWRYDEARAVIERLRADAPEAPETRYLVAQLAFIDGDYAAALAGLDGLAGAGGADHIEQLRALVASTADVTKGFAQRESAGGHFVISYPPGADEVIVDLAGDVLEAAHGALAEDFGYVPPERVRVELLPRPAELARLSTLTEREIETTGTIALCKYGKLMVVSPRATTFGYPWMDTLVHEYVHYVVSRLSHDHVPVWLHEGLARFQQVRWRSPARTALSAMDEHLVATALKTGRLITFDEMHPSMAKLPSAEAAALAFAEVYSVVGYLHGKVGYAGLRRIIELQRDGKSARRAIAEALDARWPAVERDWKAHLRGLGLKPNKALQGRARAPRVRFQKGAGSDENVGVEEVASAKARNFARLGGMLRARGMSDAAAVEYEKALAIAGADDPFVAAKLSRTYIELGRYVEAIRLAEPLLAADENDAAAAVTLALAHRETGAIDRARAAFERALAVSPFDPAVRCGLAEVYEKQGEQALAARERAACRRLRQ